MTISDAQIEVFGFAFWPVNAATKIGTHREELRAALSAALSVPQAPDGWKPIDENTPKDGTLIWLAVIPDWYGVGVYDGASWNWVSWSSTPSVGSGRGGTPTHWMPLPPSPQPEGRET